MTFDLEALGDTWDGEHRLWRHVHRPDLWGSRAMEWGRALVVTMHPLRREDPLDEREARTLLANVRPLGINRAGFLSLFTRACKDAGSLRLIENRVHDAADEVVQRAAEWLVAEEPGQSRRFVLALGRPPFADGGPGRNGLLLDETRRRVALVVRALAAHGFSPFELSSDGSRRSEWPVYDGGPQNVRPVSEAFLLACGVDPSTELNRPSRLTLGPRPRGETSR